MRRLTHACHQLQGERFVLVAAGRRFKSLRRPAGTGRAAEQKEDTRPTPAWRWQDVACDGASHLHDMATDLSVSLSLSSLVFHPVEAPILSPITGIGRQICRSIAYLFVYVLLSLALNSSVPTPPFFCRPQLLKPKRARIDEGPRSTIYFPHTDEGGGGWAHPRWAWRLLL